MGVPGQTGKAGKACSGIPSRLAGFFRNEQSNVKRAIFCSHRADHARNSLPFIAGTPANIAMCGCKLLMRLCLQVTVRVVSVFWRV